MYEFLTQIPGCCTSSNTNTRLLYEFLTPSTKENREPINENARPYESPNKQPQSILWTAQTKIKMEKYKSTKISLWPAIRIRGTVYRTQGTVIRKWGIILQKKCSNFFEALCKRMVYIWRPCWPPLKLKTFLVKYVDLFVLIFEFNKTRRPGDACWCDIIPASWGCRPSPSWHAYGRTDQVICKGRFARA